MIRIGLVGAGRIGSVHARHLLRHPTARIVSVYDPIVARAEAVAAAHGATVVGDWRAIVEAGDVDAVIVASSTETHPTVVRAAVAADKAVYCEKPLAASLAEAVRLHDDLATVPNRVMVGFNRRFDRNHAKVAAEVHDGRIGRLQTVQITSRGPNAIPGPDYLRVSGNLFYDKMVHFFDLIRWLSGEEPVEVIAQGSVIADPVFAEFDDVDTAQVVIRLESGALCLIDNARRAAYGYDDRIEVFGTGGLLESSRVTEGHVMRILDDGIRHEGLPKDPMIRMADSYAASIAAFVDFAAGLRDDVPRVADGLEALILAEAATRSWKEKRFVSVVEARRSARVRAGAETGAAGEVP